MPGRAISSRRYLQEPKGSAVQLQRGTKIGKVSQFLPGGGRPGKAVEL